MLSWWLEKQALMHVCGLVKSARMKGRRRRKKSHILHKGVCRVLENDRGSVWVLWHLGKISYVGDGRGCGFEDGSPCCRLRVDSPYRD